MVIMEDDKHIDDRKSQDSAPEQESARKTASDSANRSGGKKRRHVWIWRVLLGLLLALVILIVLLVLFLDQVVKGSVNTVGPRITGTPVVLEDVKISLLRGRVELRGFRVGNPGNCRKPNALDLGSFVCQVRPGSLFGNKIVVDEILIDNVAVDYEPNIVSGSNLEVILGNAKKFFGVKETAEAEEKTPSKDAADAEQKPAKEVVIRVLHIAGVGFTVGTIGVALPDVDMTDVGEGQSLDETLARIYGSLMQGVNGALSSELLKSAGQELKKIGGDVGQAGADLGEALNKTGGDLEKDVNKAVDSLMKLL